MATPVEAEVDLAVVGGGAPPVDGVDRCDDVPEPAESVEPSDPVEAVQPAEPAQAPEAPAPDEPLGPAEVVIELPADEPVTPAARNEVVLVGRVSGEPLARELPSGDSLVSWRVVVDRPADTRPQPRLRAPTVDTLDCTAWSEVQRSTALGLVTGDVVEVHGALRRRFWRAGAGAASRCEVEVLDVRRLSPPQQARPTPTGPDR